MVGRESQNGLMDYRVCLFAPWLALFILVFWLGTDIWIWDEWQLYSEFVWESRTKGIDLDGLWLPHNEHRMPLLRLLMYALSFLTLSPIPLMYFSVILCGLNFYLLMRGFGAFEDFKSWPLYLCFLFSAFGFSLGQKQIFFWGMLVQWELCLLGIILTLLIVRSRPLFSLVPFTLLSYTSLGYWVVIPPILLGHLALRLKIGLSPKVAIRVFVIYGIIFSIAFGAHVSDNPVARAQSTVSIWQYIQFFLTMLGSPFQTIDHKYLAPLMGIIFLYFVIGHVKKGLLELTSFSFQMMAVSIMASFIGAFGRASYWDSNLFIKERYVSFVLPGWLAIILITWRLYSSYDRIRRTVLILLVLQVGKSFSYGVKHEKQLHENMIDGRGCLERAVKVGHYVDDLSCVVNLYPSSSDLLNYAKASRERGWLWWVHGSGDQQQTGGLD